MKEIKEPGLVKGEVVFDEAFLLQVDRAVLLSKEQDPFRLGQVARAAEEEIRIAHLTGVHDAEGGRRRDRREPS